VERLMFAAISTVHPKTKGAREWTCAPDLDPQDRAGNYELYWQFPICSAPHKVRGHHPYFQQIALKIGDINRTLLCNCSQINHFYFLVMYSAPLSVSIVWKR
jgi:hypothetical protein